MTPEEPEEFSDRLRLAMQEEDLTQGRLERLAGFTSRGYINRLLAGTRGKRPSHETVARLAKILHVREEWLANGELPMRAAYGSLSARGKAVAAAKDHDVLPETFLELETRHPAAAHGEETALWWLERIIELNKEVRLRLAEARATKKQQSLAREMHEHRKAPPPPKSHRPSKVRTGTDGGPRR